eukprot:g3038.t1
MSTSRKTGDPNHFGMLLTLEKLIDPQSTGGKLEKECFERFHPSQSTANLEDAEGDISFEEKDEDDSEDDADVSRNESDEDDDSDEDSDYDEESSFERTPKKLKYGFTFNPSLMVNPTDVLAIFEEEMLMAAKAGEVEKLRQGIFVGVPYAESKRFETIQKLYNDKWRHEQYGTGNYSDEEEGGSPGKGSLIRHTGNSDSEEEDEEELERTRREKLRKQIEKSLENAREVDDRIDARKGAIFAGRKSILLKFDVDAIFPGTGETALHFACTFGHTKVVKMLLKANVDIFTTDDNGQTCIHVACARNQAACISLILRTQEAKNGKLVLQENQVGLQPVHIAASTGALESLKALGKAYIELLPVLRKEAEEAKQKEKEKKEEDDGGYLSSSLPTIIEDSLSNIIDQRWHWTPLHHAAQQGHLETVKYLVENGARLHTEAKISHKTPHDIAFINGQDEIVSYFQSLIEKYPLHVVLKSETAPWLGGKGAKIFIGNKKSLQPMYLRDHEITTVISLGIDNVFQDELKEKDGRSVSQVDREYSKRVNFFEFTTIRESNNTKAWGSFLKQLPKIAKIIDKCLQVASDDQGKRNEITDLGEKKKKTVNYGNGNGGKVLIRCSTGTCLSPLALIVFLITKRLGVDGLPFRTDAALDLVMDKLPYDVYFWPAFEEGLANLEAKLDDRRIQKKKEKISNFYKEYL